MGDTRSATLREPGPPRARWRGGLGLPRPQATRAPRRGGRPTVPLDPPTAYTLGALFVLLGTGLVRAGRGKTAFYAGALFTCFFALSVQPFLYRWTAWMYAYLVSEERFRPGVVAVPFFVAVAGAGIAGAYVSLHLVRGRRMALAVVNVLLGAGIWACIQAATFQEYMTLAPTLEAYRFGAGVPLASVPAFQRDFNLAGAAQGLVGVSLAIWLVVAGRRAVRAAAVQPDAAPEAWRHVAEGPKLPVEAVPPPIEDGKIVGTRPGDGAPLPPVDVTPLAEVPALLARAREAQGAWARLPLAERVKRVEAAGKALLAAGKEAVRLLEDENGRPQAESWFFEVLPTADLFAYWCKRAPVELQPDPVELDPIAFPGKRGAIEKLPRGVVLVISPWNMPLNLPLRPAIPALLAGNAVVLKPSEHTARCGALLGKIFGEALPPGVFQVAQGGGDLGAALVEGGVDLVSFTGSPRTGRAVAEAAARQLTPALLELGGKDAAIVLADADLARAARGLAWGAVATAGQNCAGIERCYVMKQVAPALVEKLKAHVSKLRTSGPELDVGPLTTEAQAKLVAAQLAEAKARGVPFALGGEASGRRIAPTILVDPPEDLALCREETFGPVLPIFTVADEEEAVRRANASPYGLTASVWSKDTYRAETLGRRLQAGVVTVNNHGFTGGVAGSPWGGVRGSGYGVTNAARTLDEVTRPRFVLVDESRGKAEPWWYPYDRSALDVGEGMAALRAGDLGALGRVVRGFLGRGKS